MPKKLWLWIVPLTAAFILVGSQIIQLATTVTVSLVRARPQISSAVNNYPTSVTHGGATPYTFMSNYPVVGGQAPIRWPSCTSLIVLMERAGMPQGAEGDVRSAATELARYSGLSVRVTVVDHIPTGLLGAGVIPVRWVQSSTAMCKSEMAAACTMLRLSQSHGGTVTRISDARIYVYSDGAQSYVRRIMLHELGHAIGLDHVSAMSEMMYKAVTSRDRYGPGDIAGLKVAGQGVC